MNIKKKIYHKVFSSFLAFLLLFNSIVSPVLSQTITPEITQLNDLQAVDSTWTHENVELNKEYIYDQNKDVKLTFTKLPNPSGNIRIEELTLTDEQVKQTNSLTNIAYEITSNMKDGEFAYNLTLPLPQSDNNEVTVKFSEDISEIGSAEKINNPAIKSGNAITVADLDHFTIFVVSGVTPPSCAGATITPPGGTTACFTSIQDAIASAVSGDTINVAPGTYTEVGQIVIDKDLTIVGTDKTTTIVKPAQGTGGGNHSDNNAWILVKQDVTFNLRNVTLDGADKSINHAILSHGHGTIDNNIITNISYSKYVGIAIELYGSDMTINNNTFNNIARIGVYNGFGTTSTITNNTYVGKGNGDFLDYAFEVGRNGKATIENNNISNNKGVAASDGSTSAGILVTSYFDPANPSSATIKGNIITDSTYGVAVGYADDDKSTITQFVNNTFSNNDFDLDNHTINNIDARVNVWSVADQNSLDLIDSKINHNCGESSFVHGVCSGGSDYGTGLAFVRYKDIATPTNSGWNIQSKSATPNETPLDFDCSKTAYTNENKVSQNWTSVDGVNIKYQREVSYPSGSISYFDAGTNIYTPFSTFGSASGIEGLWKTRVRGYVDFNKNNKYDSGEDSSSWSNECKIVFDKTAPAAPANGTPHDTSIPTNVFDFNWQAVTDLSPVKYEFQSTLNPSQSGGILNKNLWHSGILPSNTIHSSGASNGKWYWQVRAIDGAGNTSAWSEIWNVTIDRVAPTVDLVFPTPGSSSKSFKAVFSESVNMDDAENPANYFLNNWPGAGGSGDLVGDATIAYDPSTKTATVNFTNPSWYISPEQQWGVQNIHDLAGNLQLLNPYSEYSTAMVAPTTTDSGTDGNWHKNPVTVNFSCTDLGGSGCKSTYYTTDGTEPTTSSPTGNSVTLSGEGVYTIKYFSIDKAGNKEVVKTAANTVKIDITNPSKPVITSPTSEQHFKTSPILNKWGAISDLSGIRQYTVEYIYDDHHTFSGAPYRYTTTNYRNHSPAISEQGGVTIRVRAEDNAGNLSEWSEPIHYIYDATAPTVSSVSSDGALYNLSSTDPNVKVTFNEDLSTPPGINVHSTSSTQLVNDCSDSDAKTYCFTYDLLDEEASHTIEIFGAKDLAGNMMTANSAHTFAVDRVAPILTSKTVFSGWFNVEKISTFVYSDTNGILSGNNPTCTITTEGTDQTCTVTPNVCDNSGNCNTTPINSNSANIDFTDPESIITTPSNPGTGSTLYASSWNGAIQGTATDALSGVNNVKISIENGLNQYFNGTSFVASGAEILLDTSYDTGFWSYDQLTSPEEGSYTIKSHAIDEASNMESTYTLTIILDKTIPEVTISINPNKPDASNEWYKTQPEITLTATDTNKDIIEYQWNSKSGSWTAYSTPFKPGSEGSHVLYYRSKDKAGNYSDTGVKNIQWDQTELTDGPMSIDVSPNPTAGTTSLVKWKEAKDNTGIDRYEVKWNLKDGSKSYTDSVGSDVRQHTINNLTEGTWTVQVTAFDRSGKSKSASIDLIVDKTNPNAPTLSVFETGTGYVSLSWNKVDEAVDYIIWYGTTAGAYQYGAKVGDITSYSVRGLGAGSYYFIIKAVDQAGNQSDNSNEVSTGQIAGAPNVEENTPAEGFSETVLGEATKSADLEPTGSVLGASNKDVRKKNWLWLLLFLLIPIFWVVYKKVKRQKE